jgi:hypothetical protein
MTKYIAFRLFVLPLALLLIIALFAGTETGRSIVYEIIHGLSTWAASSTGIELAFAIIAYTVTATIFLPVPLEGPLLFTSIWPLWLVLGVSAIGRALGAWIVFSIVQHLASSEKTIAALESTRKFQIRVGYLKAKTVVLRHGFVAFFLLQAIPFMPTRTSLYLYSHFEESPLKVVIGATVATAIRMLLMLALIRLGWMAGSRIAL